MAKYVLKRPDPNDSVCKLDFTEEEEQRDDLNLPLTKKDLRNLEQIAAYLERSRLSSYIGMMEKPSRWIFLNIWGGIGRGIGMAIGFTILGAALFLILQKIVVLNLPIISNFFAHILDMVEGYRSVSP